MKNKEPISVIVPTYKSPDALDLCIESLVLGQVYQNQIIIVVDGHYDINKEVIEKWDEQISVLNLEENRGLCAATNLGVYNAKHKLVFVINDDNVAPNNWDVNLLEDYEPNSVLTPNQIEPYNSIYNQFVIKDFGRTIDTFDFDGFLEYEYEISNSSEVECSGGTMPFLIAKSDYLRVGGWDENYPKGMVADWDFFLKCQMSDMEMLRTYRTHFYHFVSLSVHSEEREQAELDASYYAKYKWGGFIHKNNETNLKIIQ